MDYDELVDFVQGHFTDGLALVIGSGLSGAEGIPGMPALATHLSNRAGALASDPDRGASGRHFAVARYGTIHTRMPTFSRPPE